MSKKSILKLMMAMSFVINGGVASVSAMVDYGNGGSQPIGNSPYIMPNYYFSSDDTNIGELHYNKQKKLSEYLIGVYDRMNSIVWGQLKSKKAIYDLLRSEIEEFTNALTHYNFKVEFNSAAFNNLKISDFKDFYSFVLPLSTYLAKMAYGKMKFNKQVLNFKDGIIKISYTKNKENLKVFVNNRAGLFNEFLKVFRQILKFADDGFVDQNLIYNDDDYDDSNIVSDEDIKRVCSSVVDMKRLLRKDSSGRYVLFTLIDWDTVIQGLENAYEKLKSVFGKMKDKIIINSKDINKEVKSAINSLAKPYLAIRALALKYKNPRKSLRFYHLYPESVTPDIDITPLEHFFDSIDDDTAKLVVGLGKDLGGTFKSLERYFKENDRQFYDDMNGNWRVVTDEEKSKIIGENGEKTVKEIFFNKDGEILKKLVGSIWDMVDIIERVRLN